MFVAITIITGHSQSKIRGGYFMKKRIVFVIIALAVTSSLLTSGCGTSKSSYAAGGSSSIEATEQNESNGVVIYKSLIDKYVGKDGTEYKAHAYMLKKSASNRYTAEEWTDSDGSLRLPFAPDAIKETVTVAPFGEYKALDELTGLECFYVPDELAAKASTAELADIFMSYGYNSGIILALATRPDSEYFEHEFEYDLSHCNALEESLRRNDFAGEYWERYMTETVNMPEYCEGMEEENFDLYSSGADKTRTLNMLEVLLAQPESYEQLTDEQRSALVRRVIEKEKMGEQGKLFYSDAGYRSFFFACIAGELYLHADMAAIPDTTGGLTGITGAIERDNNPWLDTINRMDFTEEEQKILEKYFVLQ